MIFRKIAALILLLTLWGCAEPLYTNIDNDKLQSLMVDGIPLYDIRRSDEWLQTGVIKGSRLVTFIDDKGRVNERLFSTLKKEVRKSDPVILICRSGNRSAVLSRQLTEKMGYTQVYNVEDGIVRWMRERKPLARPDY